MNGRSSRRRVWLWRLTWVNAGLMVAVWLLISAVSESHWLGSAVTFLPRLPWLIPGLLLVAGSAVARSRSLWLNVGVTLLSLVTIAGFNVPMAALFGSASTVAAVDSRSSAANNVNDAVDSSRQLRVVSCNVQSFRPDFALLLREIHQARPDVVVFQEAFEPPPMLAEFFDGWFVANTDAYWIASRWPVSLIGRCHSEVFDREIGIAAEVASPIGAFTVVDLHLMTARRSLMSLKSRGVLTGQSQVRVSNVLAERQAEANDARVFVTKYSRHRPTVICGDFNMPSSSSILRTSFGEFTNAFDAVAWGFGCTAPCRPIWFWPRNTPWQRIDHIFTNQAWQVAACRIGQFDGSDHRLITATLRLREVDAIRNSSAEPSDSPNNLDDEIQKLLR